MQPVGTRLDHPPVCGAVPVPEIVFAHCDQRVRHFSWRCIDGRRADESRPVGGLLGAFDDQHAEFHERMRSGYLSMARKEPSRIKIVDAGGSAAETHSNVLALVLSRLEE